MVKYPTHMVKIDDQEFYAKTPTSDSPYKSNRWVEFKVLEGPTANYMLPGYDLRAFKFSVVLYGDVAEVRGKLEKLVNKSVEFASPYIGAFTAMVKYTTKYQDGTPDTTYVDFEIREIS